MEYYLVKYKGPFGFIKPWTAVRDGNTNGIATYSQQFLTSSIVEGIEKKLFPELLRTPGILKVRRNRLSYEAISDQMEQTQTRGWNIKKKFAERPRNILTRGVMINPILWLAFDNIKDATVAATQHICLCRNEDILLPDEQITKASLRSFDTDEDQFAGFELIFEETEDSFLTGYGRFNPDQPMYGWLKIIGEPVKPRPYEQM